MEMPTKMVGIVITLDNVRQMHEHMATGVGFADLVPKTCVSLVHPHRTAHLAHRSSCVIKNKEEEEGIFIIIINNSNPYKHAKAS